MHCKNQKICIFNSLSSICIYYIKPINRIHSCLTPVLTHTHHMNCFTNESWYWYDIKIQKTKCVILFIFINIKPVHICVVLVYLVPRNHFLFFGQVKKTLKGNTYLQHQFRFGSETFIKTINQIFHCVSDVLRSTRAFLYAPFV